MCTTDTCLKRDSSLSVANSPRVYEQTFWRLKAALPDIVSVRASPTLTYVSDMYVYEFGKDRRRCWFIITLFARKQREVFPKTNGTRTLSKCLEIQSRFCFVRAPTTVVHEPYVYLLYASLMKTNVCSWTSRVAYSGFFCMFSTERIVLRVSAKHYYRWHNGIVFVTATRPE